MSDKGSTVNIQDFQAKGLFSSDMSRHANELVRKVNGYPESGNIGPIGSCEAIIKVAKAMSGTGYYTGSIVGGSAILNTTQLSDDLDLTKIAGLSLEIGCYVLNLSEDTNGPGGSPLTEKQFVKGTMIGNATDGYPVYATGATGDNTCTITSPHSVTTGCGISPCSDEWTRADDESEPVDMWVVSRLHYDATGPTLYYFARKLRFDGCGKLWFVSGEDADAVMDLSGNCTDLTFLSDVGVSCNGDGTMTVTKTTDTERVMKCPAP